MPKGYKQISVNGKSRLLHRVLAAQELGRDLQSDEIVHHKNEDGFDNRHDNRQVMTRGQHNRLHKAGKFKWPLGFVLDEIRRVAQEIGHRPACKKDFEPRTGIGHASIDRMFGSWIAATNEALGLKLAARTTTGARTHHGPGYIDKAAVLADVQRVAGLVGRPPTLADYKLHGAFSYMAVLLRFNKPGHYKWPTSWK